MANEEAEVSLEEAVKCAMSEFRHWGDRVRSSRLPHCFWGGGWLAAVYVQPKDFPHGLSKKERDSLIRECHKDGQYHSILLIKVLADSQGKPFVAKSKVLPDFNAWCKNHGQ